MNLFDQKPELQSTGGPLVTSSGYPASGRLLGQISEAVPGYVLLEPIGGGRRGVVFRARQLSLGRDVALRVFTQSARKPGPVWTTIQESRLLARASHPSILHIYGTGVFDGGGTPSPHKEGDEAGLGYLVSEMVNHGNISDMVGHPGHLPIRTFLKMGRALAGALVQAHGLGILHRDLKPENILLRETGEPLICDFGPRWNRQGRLITHPLSIHYAAPERIAGGIADEVADLYALAVIFYELLTGQLPFSGSDLSAVARAQIHSRPRNPRDLNPALSPAMCQFLTRGLEKEPRDRFTSALEVLEALRNPLLDSRRRTFVARRHSMITRTQISRRIRNQPRQTARLKRPVQESANGAAAASFLIALFIGVLVGLLVDLAPASSGPLSGIAPSGSHAKTEQGYLSASRFG